MKKRLLARIKNFKELIACLHTVMEPGFILITHRHTGCECRAQFSDYSNRKPSLVPCRRNDVTGRPRRHLWRNVSFRQFAIPGIVRSDDEPARRHGSHPAIGFHVTKINPEIARALWGEYPILEWMN